MIVANKFVSRNKSYRMVVSQVSPSLVLVKVSFSILENTSKTGLVGVDGQREDIRLASCNEARSTWYLFSLMFTRVVRNQKKFSSLPESENACQTCHRSSCITGDLKDFATLNTRHRRRCTTWFWYCRNAFRMDRAEKRVFAIRRVHSRGGPFLSLDGSLNSV